MSVYCENCRWCRPANGIVSWFGLVRDVALQFAKCGHPHATRPSVSDFVRIDPAKRPPQQFYCSNQNQKGICPDYEGRAV